MKVTRSKQLIPDPARPLKGIVNEASDPNFSSQCEYPQKAGNYSLRLMEIEKLSASANQVSSQTIL